MLNTCCCTGRQRTGFKKTRKDSIGTFFTTIGKFNFTRLLAAMNKETAIVAINFTPAARLITNHNHTKHF